jgi:hypothetical protein
MGGTVTAVLFDDAASSADVERSLIGGPRRWRV